VDPVKAVAFKAGRNQRLLNAEVDEGGGHFAPVAEFESAFDEATSGNDGDGIGRAAVDFDEGHEALAVFAARVVDAEF